MANIADTDAVALGDLLRWLRTRWLTIALGGLLGVITGGAVGQLQDPVYRSRIVLSPNIDSMNGAGLGDLMGQFGGLASLAGIRVPGGGDKQVAIEHLRSRGLVAQFISDENLLPVLFDEAWDASANRWKVPADKMPTLNDGVELFVTRIRRVQEDRGSGMVVLTIDWKDREESARWATELVIRTNRNLRDIAVREAESSIEYLKKNVENQEVVPVRETMSRLIESQTRTIVLAHAREQFAFRVVDPAVVSDADDFVSPNRPLLVVLGLLLGSMLGLALALVRSAASRHRQ